VVRKKNAKKKNPERPHSHTDQEADGSGQPRSESIDRSAENTEPPPPNGKSKPASERKHWLDYVMAALTLLAVFGAIAAAGFTGWQAYLSRSQFVASQRAWLTFEEVKVVPPTKFSTTKGADIRLEIKVKNIGNTPATKIEFGIADCFNQECWPGRNLLAERLRSGDTITQIVLFPNDFVTQARVLSIPPDKLRVVKQPGDRTEIWIDMSVGVGYAIGGDAKRHVTAYRYGVIPIQMPSEERTVAGPVSLSPSPLFDSIVD
jgi:hypothetical protein